ncbi:MAG: hypothetical protein K1X53_13485 [Candidatus Sumerlaeaceae bacterium]|nr:hypothetical protein [Candidatus Sumerlaeaceae bacterium]
MLKLPVPVRAKGLMLMKKMAAGAMALTLCLVLSGCGSGSSGKYFGQPVTRGVKSPDQVPPHVRPLAEGKETLAETLQRPEAKADGGASVMTSIQDLPPRR